LSNKKNKYFISYSDSNICPCSDFKVKNKKSFLGSGIDFNYAGSERGSERRIWIIEFEKRGKFSF